MYAIQFTADVEGDWTDHLTDGRDILFLTAADAMAWWDAHYRGPDDFGNRAYPEVVEVEPPSGAKK